MSKQGMCNIQDRIANNELLGDYQRHILTDLLRSMEEVHNAIMFDYDLARSNETAGILDDIMQLFGFE